MRALLAAIVMAVAGLAGCNGALGLEPVGSEPDDLDDDGITFDNCRDIPNTDQADLDGDGLGDACDPCPMADVQQFVDVDRDRIDDGCDPCSRGRSHDEDGDGIQDGCDNCPADHNPDQANADGDEVGDQCELSGVSNANRHTLFDSFAPADARWIQVGEPWIQEADSVLTRDPGDPTQASLLRSPDFAAVGVEWQVEVAVELRGPKLKMSLLLDSSGSGQNYRCSLDCTGSMCSMIYSSGSIGVFGGVFATNGTFRLRVTHNTVSSRIECSAAGTDVVAGGSGVDTMFGFSLAFTDPARLHFIHVQN